jgi:hypothetical protein
MLEWLATRFAKPRRHCASTFDNRYWPALYLIDAPPGDAHGEDIDAAGNGTVSGQRLYQLIRQGKPWPIEPSRSNSSIPVSGSTRSRSVERSMMPVRADCPRADRAFGECGFADSRTRSPVATDRLAVRPAGGSPAFARIGRVLPCLPGCL